MKGNEYFNNIISEIGFKGYIEKEKQKTKIENLHNILTDREIEIIKLVAEGIINKEISDKLNISTRTVDTHKANILHKLNLKSSVDIVKFAIKNELIKL
jgi:two-component system response regulator NreC